MYSVSRGIFLACLAQAYLRSRKSAFSSRAPAMKQTPYDLRHALFSCLMFPMHQPAAATGACFDARVGPPLLRKRTSRQRIQLMSPGFRLRGTKYMIDFKQVFCSGVGGAQAKMAWLGQAAWHPVPIQARRRAGVRCHPRAWNCDKHLEVIGVWNLLSQGGGLV